jgi:hypothetical protein
MCVLGERGFRTIENVCAVLKNFRFQTPQLKVAYCVYIVSKRMQSCIHMLAVVVFFLNSCAENLFSENHVKFCVLDIS